MKTMSLVLLIVTSILPAHAANEKPMDFAKGFEVELAGSGPIFSLAVPAGLYEGVSTPEMHDVALFNASGDVVPFEVLSREQMRLQKPPPNVYEGIEFTPVQDAPRVSSLQVVKLQTDTVGKVNGINIEENSKPEGKGSSSYIIDLRQSDRRLSSLKFDWDGKKDGTFIPVRIEESANLTHWSLVQDSVLVEAADQRLSQTEVSLFPIGKVALRITLRVTPETATLKSVAAAFQATAEPPDQLETKVVFAKNENGSVVYDTQGFFPIQSLQILIGMNSASVVSISSSTQEKGPWISRGNATVFDYSSGDGALRSKPITFERTRDRYWKLEFAGAGEKFLENPPGLELGWYPEEIVFVQNGNSPYQLAFGAYDIRARLAGAGNLRDQVNEQLRTNVQPTKADIGNALTLGGPEKLQPKPQDAWRKWLLPGILVIAVLLIAQQAWKLVREMNADKST